MLTLLHGTAPDMAVLIVYASCLHSYTRQQLQPCAPDPHAYNFMARQLVMSVVSQLLFCTQVPWYAVLGNHDYGDMLSSGLVGSCNGGTLARCKGSCCYSPLWQVGVQYIDAKPDLHACFAYILLRFTMRPCRASAAACLLSAHATCVLHKHCWHAQWAQWVLPIHQTTDLTCIWCSPSLLT